jgi:hypothetical protein
MARCIKPHRFNPMFAALPDDQKRRRGRHKCAACAYEQGEAAGFARRAPNFNRSSLDDSQAGVVRHKSCEAAYNLGYFHGLERHTANS